MTEKQEIPPSSPSFSCAPPQTSGCKKHLQHHLPPAPRAQEALRGLLGWQRSKCVSAGAHLGLQACPWGHSPSSLRVQAQPATCWVYTSDGSVGGCNCSQGMCENVRDGTACRERRSVQDSGGGCGGGMHIYMCPTSACTPCTQDLLPSLIPHGFRAPFAAIGIMEPAHPALACTSELRGCVRITAAGGGCPSLSPPKGQRQGSQLLDNNTSCTIPLIAASPC